MSTTKVWITTTRYHRSYDCATSRYKDKPQESTEAKAEAKGIKPCLRCAIDR